MRLILPAILAFSLSGIAVAQPAPRVTIEDDVAPATAVACAGLRMAQAEAAKRAGAADLLVSASADAWLKSGVDAAKARAEAAKLASATPDAMAKKADACSVFEIRSAPPAGG
jgi:hypothetical protein